MKIVQAHITIQGSRNKDKKEWKSSVVNNPDEMRALQSVHIDNVNANTHLLNTYILFIYLFNNQLFCLKIHTHIFNIPYYNSIIIL